MTYDSESNIPPVWAVGDVILGTYKVKQVFTGGGMGLVYRVHHSEWGVDLAVKSPRPEYFQRAVQQENFERECETWINLGLHPHIVSCHYVRRLGGIPRIFAEFVEGGSLLDSIRGRQLYAGGEREALRRILDVALQVAWGLHYAHEQGLVHQDVKPANVLLTHDGTAKVTDFGLAKARAESGEKRTSDEKSILVSCGGMTPAYCSPEQFAGQAVTSRTDVWSWGLSVLEMFTGEVFWQAGIAANQALDAYLQNGSQRRGFPRMPDAIARILRECFRVNPADRSGDLLTLAGGFARTHAELFAKPYPRPQPSEITNVADGLNNRAISLLDIGWDDPAKRQKAEALFDEALRAKPYHLESTFNRGLMLWRP